MNDDFGRSDGLADVINLLATPIAGGIRAFDQIRRGSDELLKAIENLNRTMENLNEAAMRVNQLVGDIEEPIRAMMPQITRSVKAADELSQLLDAPVRAAAPNIERIADALSSPGFASLPNQLSDFMSTLGDVSKRLGPLTALAENAGGLFGGFRMPGTGGQRSTPSLQPEAATTGRTGTAKPTAQKAPSSTTTAKKSAAKKSPARKSPAKKTAAKRTTAKKSATKRTTAKKSAG